MEIIICMFLCSLFWTFSYCYLEEPSKSRKVRAILEHRFNATLCILRFSDGSLHKWKAPSKDTLDKIANFEQFNLHYKNYDIYFYDKLIYLLPSIVFGISMGIKAIYEFICY